MLAATSWKTTFYGAGWAKACSNIFDCYETTRLLLLSTALGGPRRRRKFGGEAPHSDCGAHGPRRPKQIQPERGCGKVTARTGGGHAAHGNFAGPSGCGFDQRSLPPETDETGRETNGKKTNTLYIYYPTHRPPAASTIALCHPNQKTSEVTNPAFSTHPPRRRPPMLRPTVASTGAWR